MLAAWSLVCRPKKHGGLDILNIEVHNTALLLKFLHTFYNKRDTQWISLVWPTYYEGKVSHTSDACGSFWWRDIMNLSDIYRGVTKVDVGDGSTTLF